MLVIFASRSRPRIQIESRYEICCSRLSRARGASGTGLVLELVMGIVMKKVALLATALAMVSGSAFAADMPVKALKAPPPAAFDPWDIAFGAGIMNDYIFRGVTQSNHKPSVAAYFEPRYNVNKTCSSTSVRPPRASRSRTAPRLKSTSTAVSARPSACSPSTSVSGATCIRAEAASTVRTGCIPGQCCAGRRQFATTIGLPINGNFVKKDVSFYEVYGKLNYTINDQWGSRLQRVLFAELPEPRRLGQLRLDHRQVHRAEHHVRCQRRRHVCVG